MKDSESPPAFTLRPIGVVRCPLSDEEVREGKGQEVESIVEVFREYEEGLEGIEGFSHLYILCYLHKLREHEKGVLKVRPRRLLRRGFKLEELPLLGVFASDSPTRPNPLSLTLVELVRREGNRLHVKGLDAFDGTPIVDIKPYHPQYHVEDFNLPDWYKSLFLRAGRL